MKLQLSDSNLDLIRNIVARHVDATQHQPIIFGSRATGNSKKYSDVDLGFLGDTPLSKRSYLRIVDDLAESDLPYKVDVVDFAVSEDSFRKHALRSYQKL